MDIMIYGYEFPEWQVVLYITAMIYAVTLVTLLFYLENIKKRKDRAISDYNEVFRELQNSKTIAAGLSKTFVLAGKLIIELQRRGFYPILINISELHIYKQTDNQNIFIIKIEGLGKEKIELKFGDVQVFVNTNTVHMETMVDSIIDQYNKQNNNAPNSGP